MVRSSASRHRASSHGTPSSTFLLALVLAAAVSSCKGSLPEEGAKSQLDAIGDVAEDAVQIVDVGPETDVHDAVEFDIPLDSAVVDTAVDSCPGGEGCPCAGNDTCDNGVCLDTHEGKRCARACVDACPAGYSCQKYGSVDGAFFCVSSHLSLCAPCETHAECQVDGVLALCIAYGSEGSFCGAPCKSDGDCPGGYECKDADDGKGGTAKQCRRTAGKNCECSAWAKDKAAHTTCAVANSIGTCTAARKCGPEGLEACAAKTPKVEVCNAEDDDCDGKDDNLPADTTCTKKAYAVGGSGEECKTDDDCLSNGEGCDGGKCRPLIGACSGNPVCVGGKLLCVEAKTPEVETCNNKDDDCDGLVDEDFAIGLPDGATLAVGAVCGEGSCAGGTVKCVAFDKAACSTDDKKAEKEACDGKDDDCDGQTDEAACDDGDACTKDTCDEVKLACGHTAAVDCDDGEVCTADKCDAKTGECSHDGDAQDTKACTDGDKCTEGDACKAGKCTAGEAKVCDDTNPCTDDTCKAEVGCIHQGNVAACDDGDACTSGDTCAEGVCKAGKAVTCADDGEVCTLESCDKAKGCVSLPAAGTCTDGDACTAGDKCAGGKCAAGEAVVCADDGEVCTAESCDKVKGCVSLPNAASCTDGDACTAGDGCSGGKCAPGAALKCDDGEVCTADSCDKGTGCVFSPLQGTCTDGDACTAGDACQAGKCASGAPLKCDDANACTADACEKAKGCVSLPAEASCTDGDACSDGDGCLGGKCIAGPAKNCDDGNACTVDACGQVDGGCGHAPSPDGQSCGEANGKCAGGLCATPCVLFDQPFASAPVVAETLIAGSGNKLHVAGLAYTSDAFNDFDAWAGTITTSGDLEWKQTWHSGQYSAFYSIVPAVGGGLLFAGFSGQGGTDAYLARVDAKGSKVWEKSYGYDLVDVTGSALALADGGFVAAGYSFAGYGDGKLSYQGYVVRVDAEGTAVWGNRYGDETFDVFNGALAEEAGTFLFGGSHGDDAWLLRTDSKGGILSQKFYKPSSKARVYDLRPHLSGGHMVSGTTSVSGSPRGWLALVSADDLSVIWEKTYGPAAPERFTGISVMSDGGLTLSGRKGDSPGSLWLVRVGPLGGLQWQRDYGVSGGQSHHPLGVVQLADGTLSQIANLGGAKAAPHLLRMDAWGETDCAKSGLCAFAKDGCHDNDACTADACDATKGCTHTPIPGCTPSKDADLDHDGLAGSADPCPTVWNPDGAKDACPAWDGAGWAQAQDLMLGQPGLQAGRSTWRRTNEPVEVPLASGIIDDSVVGYWPLAGSSTAAAGGGGANTTVGAPNTVLGPFGPTSKALWFDGKNDYLLLAKGRNWRMGPRNGAMAWIRSEGDGVAAATFTGEVCHDGGFSLTLQAVGSPASAVSHSSYTPGAGKQHTLATPFPQDGGWHHVALVRDGSLFHTYVDGMLAATTVYADQAVDNDCGNPVGVGGYFNKAQNATKGLWRGAVADLVLFGRAPSPAEIATYFQSKAPYGSSLISGAQADFDDLRVTEATGWQKEHSPHFELLGARPHSDSDLKDVDAYWKLDGNGLDSVTGKSGDVYGAGPSRGRWGQPGRAMTFNRSAKNRILTSRQFMLDKAQSLSVEAWFNATSVNQNVGSEDYGIIGAYNETSTGVGIWVNNQGTVVAVARDGSSKVSLLSNSHAFDEAGWHHVAVVRDAGAASWQLYVDGVLHRQQKDTLVKTFQWNVIVGQYSESYVSYFNGAIDEVLIHKVAKSADYFAKRARGLPRVRFLAHTGPHPGTNGTYAFHKYRLHWGNPAAKAVLPSLTALDKKTKCDALLSPCLGYAGWWRFDDLHGVTAIDSSANRLHGVLSGANGLPTLVATPQGAGISMDGVDDVVTVPDAPVLRGGDGYAVEARFTTEKTVKDGPSQQQIVAKGTDQQAAHWGLSLALAGPTFQVRDDANLAKAATVAETINGDGGWHTLVGHVSNALVTATFDAAASKAVDVAASKLSWNNAGPLTIGRHALAGYAYPFKGVVDSVRVMSRALAPDEVLRFPPTRANLPHFAGDKAYIPAGKFAMGCNEVLDKQCKASEKPQHEVQLAAYWLDRHEVSVTRYKACVDAKACSAPSTTAKECSGAFADRNNWSGDGAKADRLQHPVNCVSIAQMETYCKWVGGALPTEAEWEKAARGGCELASAGTCKSASRTWPWGEASPSCAVATMPQGQSLGCGAGTTAPVGSRPAGASPYGVHDMGGNVNELTRDFYDPAFYGKSPADNPVNLVPAKSRVTRGGSYMESSDLIRPSNRGSVALGVDEMGTHLGFRCRYDAK